MRDLLGGASVIKAWRENPVRFVKDNFGVTPDPWQEELLFNFNKHNRISMKACKGPGKTAGLSWCAWLFLSTRPSPKIAATSITWDNLSDNLWPEMAKWQQKSRFLSESFVWTKTRIFSKSSPENHFMSARSWAKGADSSQQANALAGLHADFLMFIIDEAGGVPDAVMAAAEAGLASGVETKILMAGNPTHLEGPLYRACTSERSLWYNIEITADPENPNRTPRVSKVWAKEQIEKYGRDNPWVKVNVFGQFPESSLNTLFSPNEVREAMNRRVEHDDYSFSQKRLGVDCARFGDDRTVIFPRQGLVAFRPVIMRGARSNEIAARVMAAKYKWKSEVELVDGTGGYGSGVIDSMIQAGEYPIEVQFGGKPIDNRFFNKRAEMYFLMSEWVKRGGSLPDITDLVPELCATSYTFKNGKFALESKDQVKESLGYSPDLSDALALTFAIPEQPGQNRLEQQLISESVRSIDTDWNPFE